MYEEFKDSDIEIQRYTSSENVQLGDLGLSIKQAEIHGKAVRMRDFSSQDSIDNLIFCPCCHNPVGTKEISACRSVDKLSSLGIGIPLYFRFKQFALLILIITLIGAGIFSIWDNWSANEGNQWIYGRHYFPYIAKFSIGNQGKRVMGGFHWQIRLHILMVFLILLLAVLVKYLLEELTLTLDEGIITPSDYTVRVKNIPKQGFELTEFHNFVNYKKNVVKINYVYNIDAQVTTMRKLQHWKAQKKLQDHYSSPTRPIKRKTTLTIASDKLVHLLHGKLEDADIIVANIARLQQKLSNLENDFSKNRKLAGRAFVTFRTQSGAQKFVEDLDYSWLSQVLELIRTKIFRLERRHKLFKGKYLDAKRAPEPSDIYWENLDTPLCQKIMLRGLTLLCTCLVLFIAFGINYAVYEIQLLWFLDYTHGYAIINYLFAGLSSLIVIGVNSALIWTIRKTSVLEKSKTLSTFKLSVAIKYFLSFFINTGLIPLALRPNPDRWFHENGLVMNIFLNMLSVCIISPLFEFFDPFYLLTIYKRYQLRKHISVPELQTFSQIDLNMLFENPAMEVEISFGEVGGIVATALFYLPLFPLISCIGIIGVMLSYWIQKYLIVHRYKKGGMISENIGKFFMDMTPIFCIIYILGISLFYSQISYELNLDVISLSFTILSISFITYIGLHYLLGNKNIENPHTFEQGIFLGGNLNPTFWTDYDRSNPVTAKEALKDWIDYIENHNSRELERDNTTKENEHIVSALKVEMNSLGRRPSIMPSLKKYTQKQPSMRVFTHQKEEKLSRFRTMRNLNKTDQLYKKEAELVMSKEFIQQFIFKPFVEHVVEKSRTGKLSPPDTRDRALSRLQLIQKTIGTGTGYGSNMFLQVMKYAKGKGLFTDNK